MKEEQRAEESLKSDQVRSESAYSFVYLFIYSSGRGNYFPSAPLQRSNKRLPLRRSPPPSLLVYHQTCSLNRLCQSRQLREPSDGVSFIYLRERR